MAPRKIMMIRHGEREKCFPGDFDRDAQGHRDKPSLNARGWSRAGKLVAFFQQPKAPVETPSWIFAGAPSAHSLRPMETVEQTARTLWPADSVRAQHFNVAIDRDDLDGLFAAVTAKDGVALVCWEHDRLAQFARKFQAAPAPPQDWPGDCVFDPIWFFTANAAGWAFEARPQGINPP